MWGKWNGVYNVERPCTEFVVGRLGHLERSVFVDDRKCSL